MMRLLGFVFLTTLGTFLYYRFRPPVLTPVSPKWLNENVYTEGKNGCDLGGL